LDFGCHERDRDPEQAGLRGGDHRARWLASRTRR
jgi:hypothetical protein